MDWRTIIGILLIPVIGLAAWYGYGLYMDSQQPKGEPFAMEGNLIKDNPGFEPGVWYLSYESAGSPAQSAPLIFDKNTRCGGRGQFEICNISFIKGEKVKIEGVRQEDAVLVQTLSYISRAETKRTILLYYYNPAKDVDAEGNILCSSAGLVPVERVISTASDPFQEAFRLLISGELTEKERLASTTTEFPLPGLTLAGANIDNGVAQISFVDPENSTGGGACRVGVLRAQIEATARQFPGVQEVRILPEDAFQP